jgi:hypothetical protein
MVMQGVANKRDAFQHADSADDQRKVGRDPARDAAAAMQM